MKKILVIYSARIPSVELVSNFLKGFKQSEAVTVEERQIINCKKRDIEWSDLVLAIRPFEVSAYEIIRAAKESNREVIVYLDDDLLHLPHIYSSRLRKIFTIATYTKNCNYLTEILKDCDVLWGSSEFLISKYQGLVKNGRCVCSDVCVDISQMKSISERELDINILFAGSGNHYEELNEYIIPSLNVLAKKYSNLRLTCIGLREDYINKCDVPIESIPWIHDYDDYYSMVLDRHFDIGVAPIQQADFYRCKYYNKFIEYSLLGIVGIYTDDYPYKSIVVDGENGLLTRNTVEAWTAKIDFAIENNIIMQKLVRRAQNTCTNRFSKENLINEAKKNIPELYTKDKSAFLPVSFRPNYFINHARKYANRFVELYEKIRN